MAPDLNSVPRSPRPRPPPSLSRPVSQVMGPPPLPLPPTTGAATVPVPCDNTGVGSGPGPLRHPRPLTVADLHLELEKEQEAVVNRLTRELSLLRQQTASVASTASSASNSHNDPGDYQHPSSSSHPTPSRHPSSSSLNSRGIPSGTSHLNTPPGTIAGSVNSIALSRDSGTASSSRPPLDLVRGSTGREASVAALHQSGRVSPSLSSSSVQYRENMQSPQHSRSQSHSYPNSHRPSFTFLPLTTPPPLSPTNSISSATAISRYEETAFHRAELDAVKQENDNLRQRVRELEASLKEIRQPPASRERAESFNSTASLASELRETSLADPQPVGTSVDLFDVS